VQNRQYEGWEEASNHVSVSFPPTLEMNQAYVTMHRSCLTNRGLLSTVGGSTAVASSPAP
jgi:hypothetical protein